MIGACKLNAPDASEVMRKHLRWSRLRGVRDLGFAQHPDPEAVGAALDTAADLGLCIELRTPVPQLGGIGEVAKRWPTVTFLLSHAGLPHERNQDSLAEWRAAIGALAVRPNVVCKISAAGGNSDRNWTVDSIRPWIMGCIDAFGPDRCTFGTNWPLDRLWSPYERLVGAYRQVIADLDLSSQHAVLHGTAERIFRFSL
jgi:predicted TIM-barrel fold metal-dependent hydrolase